MCGRMTLEFDIDTIKAILKDDFHVASAKIHDFKPSYNIAPTNQVVAIIQDQGELRGGTLQWGLVANWGTKHNKPMINARSESITEKPSFRESYLKRRCIILASGFYEWHRQAGTKQAYRFTEVDKPLMAMAGIWNRSKVGDSTYTCAVITTEANALMRTIHDRIPVLLDAYGISLWLNEKVDHTRRRVLFDMSKHDLKMYPVSSLANNIHNDGTECIEPLLD